MERPLLARRDWHAFDLLLVFTVLILFPILFGALVYNIAEQGRVATIRLRSTGKTPELTLRKVPLLRRMRRFLTWRRRWNRRRP